MANDLTLGLGVTIDDIQGLNKFEALGKTLKKTVQKAAEEGLLEGLKPGLDLIRNALQKNIKADQKDFLTDLYKYGASKYKEREKRENALRQHQAKLEMTSAAQLQRAANLRAIRREEKNANVNSAIAELSSSVPDAYSATSLMLQDVGLLTSRSNREAVGRDSALSYTDQKFYLGELKRKQAAQMRARLPWNEMGAKAQDKAARALYEAQHGAVSDRAWRAISAQEAFGGSALHSAWLSGASGSWERTEERKRNAELAVMRSDAVAAFEEDAAQQAAQAAEDAALQKRLISRTELEAQDRMARAKYEARYGAVSDRAWRSMSAQSAFGGDEVHSAWLSGASGSWERIEEAKRHAELKGMRSDAISAFEAQGEAAAKEAADQLNKMSVVAKSFGVAISGITQFTNMVLRSKWQESVSRNITASEMAYYQRMEEGGQIIGGTIGGILGTILGGASSGAAAGSAAGPWGALIGGIVGAIGLASLFGLPGAKGKTELEGVLKSAQYVNNVRRDFLMYSGKSGYNLGVASENAGFGSAASLNAMRWTAETLPGAMALGMVGENEMLMLSLMPEYFAAMMSGADPATLAAAYTKSVQNLPPQLRPLVATMAPGASNEMYANAMDPQYSRFLTENAYDLALYERGALGASEFFTASSRKRALADAMYMEGELQRDLNEARRGKHKKYIDLDYTSSLGAWGLGINSRYTSQGTLLAATPMYDKLTGKVEYFENATPLGLESKMYSGVIDAAKDVGEDDASFYDAVNTMRRLHETGLNLTIRVEGLGDITQQFPFSSLADGQSVSFNLGAQ